MAEIAPYVFWDLQEASSTTEVVSQGDHAITLSLTGADPFATLPNDWAVFNGANYFDVLISTLSPEIREFLSAGDGSMLMWHQFLLPPTPGTDYSPVGAADIMAPFNVVQNLKSSVLYQQRTRLPPAISNSAGSQRLDARVGDGVNTPEDLAATTEDINDEVVPVNTKFVSGIYVNNFQKQGYIFRDKFDIGGNMDLSGLGTINPIGAPDDYIRIGGGIANGGGLQFPTVGQYRYCGLMKIPALPPLGIDKYMQELFENDGVPTELRP